jgi:hypothetical protein
VGVVNQAVAGPAAEVAPAEVEDRAVAGPAEVEGPVAEGLAVAAAACLRSS